MRSGKYNAEPVTIDGVRFASTKEGARYGELKLLNYAGEIHNLRLQVPYKLIVNGELICEYRADFVYVERGVETIEDVKGMRTPEYILKRKLMKAIYGITIKET